ncbi:MAG: glycosyltransferase family 2 protein [Moorea sp. SIO3C2]|nr:glycosyltransferase family 2 protein [Moorena sp. SIO3C2]
MKISIVIPVYEEEKNLKVLIPELSEQFRKINIKTEYEIIIIDDGSSDKTWSILQILSKDYSEIKARKLSRNFGKEAALSAGLDIARGEAVIVMDGDMQHPPYLIPELIRVWHETGCDIVEAVKVDRGKESVWNKISAKLFYWIMNKLSGYDLRGASDYKLLDQKVIQAWRKMGESNLFFRGMTVWLGFQKIQIPFKVSHRVRGQSKFSILKLFNLSISGLTAFSSFPLHIVTILGIVFLIFSVILGFQTLYLKIIGEAVTGFTTVILLLLVIGSFLMISLGIMGTYVAKIYEEVKSRPRYIVTDSINE